MRETPSADRDLRDLRAEDVPLIRGAIPGPRSAAIWEADARYHATNSSGGAQFLRIAIADAHGALVRDEDGNVFIDLSSGQVVTNLGHTPEPVVTALQQEARRLLHFGDFVTAARAEFFEALAATLPPSLHTFQMYTTGSEAVEAAMRMAKSFTKRYEFVSFFDAFHGRTHGAMGLMGGLPLKVGFGPYAPGVHHSPNAYCYRCPVGHHPDTCATQCATFLDRVVEQASDGSLAAVIIEPVQGAGGVIPHPPEFLRHLREVCDRTGALLIFDEILTGAGRTGPMWAFEDAGVVPDILVAGKGLGCGYPLALTACRRDIAESVPFGRPGGGGSTFGGGNLASAAGLATLRMLEDGSVLEGARAVATAMMDSLREIQARHPIVGDVRGRGMLLGVELVRDRTTKERVDGEVVRALLLEAAQRGVLLAAVGATVRVAPPLVIDERVALRGVELFDESLGAVEATAVG